CGSNCSAIHTAQMSSASTASSATSPTITRPSASRRATSYTERPISASRFGEGQRPQTLGRTVFQLRPPSARGFSALVEEYDDDAHSDVDGIIRVRVGEPDLANQSIVISQTSTDKELTEGSFLQKLEIRGRERSPDRA